MKTFALILTVFAFGEIFGTENVSRTDIITAPMPFDTFLTKKSSWLFHFNYKNFIRDGSKGDYFGRYSLTPYREYFILEAQKLSDTSTQIVLTYPYTHGREAMVNYRAPNIKFSLEQELGVSPLNKGITICPKNVGAFLGLTLLNSGAGFFYAQYHNPVVKINPFIIIGFSLVDIAGTAMLFSTHQNVQVAGAVVVTAYKGVTLFNLAFIQWHNELAKTGYKCVF